MRSLLVQHRNERITRKMALTFLHRLLILMTLLAFVGSRAGADSNPSRFAAGELPAYLLELPDSVRDVLIADTGTATLYRFEIKEQAVIDVDARYMSIGLNGAGKQRAWDRKTPLGVYFITDRLDTSRMADKYGVAAFPLDYPNAWDRHQARTGNGIWLHGVDHKQPRRPPRDTDGCLALPNQQLLQLADRLQPLTTPVIVARQIEWALPAELAALRREFRAVLDRWRQSLEQGDLLTYLTLYHDEFTHRGMDKPDWASYRLDVFDARELLSVELKDVLLLLDPDEPDLYLSRFTQVSTTAGGPVTMTKRLYWKRRPGNVWQIVSEDAG